MKGKKLLWLFHQPSYFTPRILKKIGTKFCQFNPGLLEEQLLAKKKTSPISKSKGKNSNSASDHAEMRNTVAVDENKDDNNIKFGTIWL
jgi:hypothetical protein